MTKSCECEHAGLTGDRLGRMAGHKQDEYRIIFPWMNYTWQTWHLHSTNKRAWKKQIFLCDCLSGCDVFLVFPVFHFTPPFRFVSPHLIVPLIIYTCLPCSYFLLVSPTYIFISFSTSVCSIFSAHHLPTRLCQSVLFIYIELGATGCTLVVY